MESSGRKARAKPEDSSLIQAPSLDSRPGFVEIDKTGKNLQFSGTPLDAKDRTNLKTMNFNGLVEWGPRLGRSRAHLQQRLRAPA